MDRQTQPTGSGTLLAVAILALVAGILVYVTARAPGSTWFLTAAGSVALPWPAPVLQAAGSLPSFFHTLGFCLLLSVCADAKRRGALGICLSWFLVEAAFETGQRPDISPWLAANIPTWVDQVWLLERSRSYFSNGVFDPCDMLAAGAGAAAAMLVLGITERQRRAES